MATRILSPTPLRPYTDKKDAVETEGATVGALLAKQTKKHGGLKLTSIKSREAADFVNVYLKKRHPLLPRNKRRYRRRHGSISRGRRRAPTTEDLRGGPSMRPRELPHSPTTNQRYTRHLTCRKSA